MTKVSIRAEVLSPPKKTSYYNSGESNGHEFNGFSEKKNKNIVFNRDLSSTIPRDYYFNGLLLYHLNLSAILGIGFPYFSLPFGVTNRRKRSI